MNPILGRQTGFAAIAAIFILLVLATLGAFMVSFSNTQQINSAQDVQGSRAYWAARAGLEWAVIAIPATPALCPNAAPTVVTGGAVPAAIEGFALELTCAVTTYSDVGINASTSTRIFQFKSTAKSSTAVGGIAYVERSVSTSLEF